MKIHVDGPVIRGNERLARRGRHVDVSCAGGAVQATLADALGDAARRIRRDGAELRARWAEARWRMENWFTVETMMDGVEAALRGLAVRG